MSENETELAYRNRVKDNYGFSDWAGRVKEGNSEVRLKDFVIPKELSGWKLAEREELPTSGRQQRVVRYIFISAREKERLVTTIFECSSVIEAHEALIDVVMTYMAPNLPRCESKGLAVGDICFGGHGDRHTAVIFARFNLIAEVQSVGPEMAAVDEFARAVDAEILAHFRRTPLR